MKFSEKCCIVCMADYTFGDYVSFINMTDTTNEYHDSLILNQIHDMHITSPLKFMAEIFESFPNLFIDHMFKNWTNAHIQIVAQLSKVNLCNKDNQQMEQIYNSRY